MGLGLALEALAFSGCGESDEEKVRQVAELVANRSPECCEHLTEGFVADISESMRAYKKDDEVSRRGRVEVVAVDGDSAHVLLSFEGFRSRIELAKNEGDWKVHSFSFVNPPKIRRGLSAREAAEAYYKAIHNEDGGGFSGILTRRHARDVLGDSEADNPLAACVAAIEDFDWSQTRKRALGVRATDVSGSGDRWTVGLSNGKRVLVKGRRSLGGRRDQAVGRWDAFPPCSVVSSFGGHEVADDRLSGGFARCAWA